MTNETQQLIAEARAAAFSVDQGGVDERLDAAIADATDSRSLGEMLLARAVLRQGLIDFREIAVDCRSAFHHLRQTECTGSAAFAAAFGAGMMHRAGDLEGAVDLAVEAMVMTERSEADADTARAANALSIFYGEIAAFGLALRYGATAFETASTPAVKEIAAWTSVWIATEAVRAGGTVDFVLVEQMVRWLETEAPTEFGQTFLAPNARIELALVTGDMANISTIRLDESVVDTVPPRIATIHRMLLGSVAHLQGDLLTARRHLDIAIPELETMDEQLRLVRAYRERSRVRAGLGDIAGALSDAHAEADFIRSIQIRHVESLSMQITTRVALEIGRTALVARAAELTEAVRVDPVTKVGTRRWLEMAFDDLEDGVGDATVAMFDLDHFKRVNDRFGHAFGDVVLERVGSILASCAGSSELVARYGGEEFTVVFPGEGLDVGVGYAERVRERLGVEGWHELDATLDVRVSVGVATGSITSIRSTLDAADRALYAAKAAGRDRILTG